MGLYGGHIMGFGCSYHPYECSHDKYCEHCTWAVFEGHNPKECALCQDLGFQLVNEPFAVKITPIDYSHRKLKIPIKNVTQETIPF